MNSWNFPNCQSNSELKNMEGNVYSELKLYCSAVVIKSGIKIDSQTNGTKLSGFPEYSHIDK